MFLMQAVAAKNVVSVSDNNLDKPIMRNISLF